MFSYEHLYDYREGLINEKLGYDLQHPMGKLFTYISGGKEEMQPFGIANSSSLNLYTEYNMSSKQRQTQTRKKSLWGTEWK